MRIGVHVGPFWVSGGGRRGPSSGRGCATRLIFFAALALWPLLLGHERGGGRAWWAWTIAGVWWALLALIALGLAAANAAERKTKAPASAQNGSTK